ncbi:MAG TPA: peroxidase-related enzyme, partial [Burkholderiaceae bacterium]|nr:peroxidase-related enzyme [Burkholderiaceae bacterium]
MDHKPISRWPVPAIADLPEDLRQRILDVQAKAGFVPNVFLAFAHRPAEARAFFDWHDALLLKETGTLTKAEREMIIVATSGANQCLYCVVAHGAILRVYARQPQIADQVATN